MVWVKGGVMAVLGMALAATNIYAQDTHIVVRTFNNYRVPAADLRDAQAHAAAALKGAGIDVTWIQCWYGDQQPADAPTRCREEVGSDIVLRLQRAAGGNGGRYISLGFSLVMPKGRPFLATVYADLAEGVAHRAGVSPQPILGHAIAHEIGHLLLNTNSHPDQGLMRAAWSQQELRRNDERDWQFREPEAATMHASIAQRAGKSE